MTTVKVEWGCQIDCQAEGCATPCPNDGVVFVLRGTPDRSVPARVENHASRWVRRVTTYSPWEEP